jgi:hypothetical protein
MNRNGLSDNQLLIRNITVTASGIDQFSTTITTWKHIAGWPYEANSRGEIRHIAEEQFNWKSKSCLKGGVIKNGRRVVTLSRRLPGQPHEHKCFSWHKLIAETFLGPCPDGQEIDHIDADPLNNAISNLRYVTASENILQSVKRGHRGSNRWNAKLTEERVKAIRLMWEDGWTVKEISSQLLVSESSVYHIIRNRNWKDVA